jgi:hypothetical protein
MKKLILSMAVAALCGCTAPDRSTSALKAAGYTDIELTGYSFFACSESDQFATGFRAKGPTGVKVEGTVCAGFLKGSTIRLD